MRISEGGGDQADEVHRAFVDKVFTYSFTFFCSIFVLVWFACLVCFAVCVCVHLLYFLFFDFV